MENTNNHDIFRLSAILYADNNYEVAPQTIHKKIIESALLENGNTEMSVSSIILFIQENYSILLAKSEVQNILSSSKGNAFDMRKDGNDTYLRINKKREVLLQSKIADKTIDSYVSNFETLFSCDGREIINKFFYESFQTSVESFQKLIKPDKQQAQPINIQSESFSDQEKDIINNFLNWDNPSKNKAIFDLSSLALEYCLLTNNSSGIGVNNLKNKIFYLDTNVIYRALGINGESRKELTKTFISKFNQVGEKLCISKATDKEFRETIKFHVDCIRKYQTPKVNSKIYSEYSQNDEIFNFYHKWRANRSNDSIDLFLAHLFSQYETFIQGCKIEIDEICPYDINDDEVKKYLKETAEAILSFKMQYGNNVFHQSAMVDAENILWIEKKRLNRNKDIRETSHFIISTDQTLRKWDYQRSSLVPVVMLPSQWLSVLLRYVERSNDDYKSFVSFLNLRNNEQLIDSEKLQVVLAGISEVTLDLDEQRNILNILVDNRFKDVLEGIKNDDDVLAKSRIFAQTETDKAIERLKTEKAELTNLSAKATSKTEKFNILIKTNEEHLSKTKSELAIVVNEYNQLILEKRAEFVQQKVFKWKLLPLFMIFCSVLIVFFLLLLLINVDSSWNLFGKLFTLTDTMKSETGRDIIRTLLGGAIIAVLGTTWKLIISRLCSSRIEEYKNTLELAYVEKNPLKKEDHN